MDFLDVTIIINPKGNIHNKPLLTFIGLPVLDKEEFIYGLEELIQKLARTFSLKNQKQEIHLIDAVKNCM